MAGNREQGPATPVGWIFGLVDAVIGLVPGGRTVQRTLESVERLLLGELKSRLDRLGPAASETNGARGDASVAAEARGSSRETPSSLLAALLERSNEDSAEDAREHAFLAILRRLSPDEARILGALSDGAGHAVVHLTAASTLRASTRRVLSNVSSIGQTAGVQLRDMTPRYVAHLLELALVELAPEDPELQVKYEILESSTEIREAGEKIEREERMTRARTVRRTIRLTPLGRDLWAACNSHERSR